MENTGVPRKTGIWTGGGGARSLNGIRKMRSSGGMEMLWRAHNTATPLSKNRVRNGLGQLSKGTLATGPDNLARGRSQIFGFP